MDGLFIGGLSAKANYNYRVESEGGEVRDPLGTNTENGAYDTEVA